MVGDGKTVVAMGIFGVVGKVILGGVTGTEPVVSGAGRVKLGRACGKLFDGTIGASGSDVIA